MIALIVVLGLSACNTATSGFIVPSQNHTYAIDRSLKSFYHELDGENLLGAGISPSFEMGGELCQYTVNALLCLDTQARGVGRFRLMPLGAEMEIGELPSPSDPQENNANIDGYVIYPDILPLYQHFYGILYAGKPLTNAFFNPTTNRIEQYFENLGFYARSNDGGPEVGLIPYGREVCRDECPQDITGAIPPANLPRNDPLTDMVVAVEFLGGENLFGSRLSDLKLAPDGNLEIVYEKAAFYAPLDDPRQIHMRELPARLGNPVMEPGPRLYGVESHVDFYPTAGDLGFHIPLAFESFLQEHGGMSLSGNPIGEPVKYDGMNPRQCFLYICLEYDENAPAGKQVALLDLGHEYLAIDNGLQPVSTEGGVGAQLQGSQPAGNLLSFQVSEKYPQVRRSQDQTIELFVFDRKTLKPTAHVSASLTLTLPGGSQLTYEFPPSDASGYSFIAVPPAQAAADGSLVSYTVCLNDVNAACKSEAYLVWGD